MGGETLSDLRKPPDVEWPEFTVATLEAAFAAGRPVLFDLTYVQDIANVLKCVERQWPVRGGDHNARAALPSGSLGEVPDHCPVL